MSLSGVNLKTGEMEVHAGMHFEQAVRDAMLSALGHKLGGSPLDKVFFVFNGVTVNVAHDSVSELITRDWERAMNGYIGKEVGPYPKAELSEEEIQADHRKYEDNVRKERKARAEYEARRNREKEALSGVLATAPEIDIVDPDSWERIRKENSDPYGDATLRFAERWARLMQTGLSAGKTLEEVAKPTSDQADVDGISGSMFGFAAGALVRCWKHGRELEALHDLGKI